MDTGVSASNCGAYELRLLSSTACSGHQAERRLDPVHGLLVVRTCVLAPWSAAASSRKAVCRRAHGEHGTPETMRARARASSVHVTLYTRVRPSSHHARRSRRARCRCVCDDVLPARLTARVGHNFGDGERNRDAAASLVAPAVRPSDCIRFLRSATRDELRAQAGQSRHCSVVDLNSNRRHRPSRT
jgi:hypothetical protein